MLACLQVVDGSCRRVRDEDSWKCEAGWAVSPLLVHELGRRQVHDLPPDRGDRRGIWIWDRVVIGPMTRAVLVDCPTVGDRLPGGPVISKALQPRSQADIGLIHH